MRQVAEICRSWLGPLQTHPKRTCRIAGALALTLWGAAFFFPAYYTSEKGLVYDGLYVASAGFLGPLALNFAWYANIPWLLTLIALFRGRAPRRPVVQIISLLLALTALMVTTLFGRDEGYTVQTWPGPACYLWIASFLPGLIMSLWGADSRKDEPGLRDDVDADP